MSNLDEEPPRYRDLAYLLAMNFKTLSLLILAFIAGEWLEKNYVTPVNGYAVSFFCAAIVIIYTWYIFFRRLLAKK